jgi:hypothetical protein
VSQGFDTPSAFRGLFPVVSGQIRKVFSRRLRERNNSPSAIWNVMIMQNVKESAVTGFLYRTLANSHADSDFAV